MLVDFCPNCAWEDVSRITAGVDHWLLRCEGCGFEWTLTDEELMRQ